MNEHILDITGISKAKILACLYNNSRPLGMGFLHFDPAPMTEAEAEALLKEHTYFDYLKGRVMKLGFDKPYTLNVGLYDRDNGPGAAKRALVSDGVLTA